MPAWDYEIEEALEEGGDHHQQSGSLTGFLEKDSRVSGVEFKTCTSVFDDACVFNPSYDETDLSILEADTVIVAIGQAGRPLLH